jgi:LPS sulfotransferase NodH
MLRAQEDGWRGWFAEEDITPIDVSYPVLCSDFAGVAGSVMAALGLDPRLAPGPALERQADRRSDEWAQRYRVDAEQCGLPT